MDYVFSVSNLVPATPRVRPQLRDPDDERILEVAIERRAMIVMFNTKDFAGVERLGVVVWTPREFLKSLEGTYEQH